MNDLIVIKVEQARNLLAQAVDAESAKRVVDLARAAEVYARRQGLSEECVAHATAIRIDATTLLGEFLEAMQKNVGGRPPKTGDKLSPVYERPPTYKDAGIEKREAVEAQFLAEIKRSKPDLHSDVRSGRTTISKARSIDKATTRCEVAASPAEVVSSLQTLIDAGQKFGTIYADPPWQYGNQATRASTDKHYVTMPVADIAALPIAQLAADNAHLHLWTTNAFLFETQKIMAVWGFEYKSVLVWCKPQMGIGNYWRVSHEFLLLGVRGKCPFGARDKKSWFTADRTAHSAKPQEARRMVEAVSPGPRLELFGRAEAENWTVWGNQVQADTSLFSAPAHRR